MIMELICTGWTFPWAVTAVRGTHYCTREYSNTPGVSLVGHHYSYVNGSYQYDHPDGTSYYNDGKGGSFYTQKDGSGWIKQQVNAPDSEEFCVMDQDSMSTPSSFG